MEQSKIENKMPENASSNESDVVAQIGQSEIQSEMTTPNQFDQSITKSSSQIQSSSSHTETSKVGSSTQAASTPLPGSSSQVASSAESSNINGPAPKKPRLDYHSMSTGVYLDSTVVPILHLALVTLDRVRPEDPVQFVIDFLLSNKAKYSKSLEQPVPGTSVNQA